LSQLRKNGFVPTGFKDTVKQAINTPASLLEMERAHRTVEKIVGNRADNWIPLHDNIAAYHSIGVDTKELSAEQKKRSMTDQSVWSIVNGMTHVATHANDILLNEPLDEAKSTQMMVDAGNMLAKDFDMANEMPSPFSKNVLNETTQIGAILN
jgi:hypothetical protein